MQSHYLADPHGALPLPELAIWHYAGDRNWHVDMTREQAKVHATALCARQLAHILDQIEGRESVPLYSAEDGLPTQATTQAELAAAAA